MDNKGKMEEADNDDEDDEKYFFGRIRRANRRRRGEEKVARLRSRTERRGIYERIEAEIYKREEEQRRIPQRLQHIMIQDRQPTHTRKYGNKEPSNPNQSMMWNESGPIATE